MIRYVIRHYANPSAPPTWFTPPGKLTKDPGAAHQFLSLRIAQNVRSGMALRSTGEYRILVRVTTPTARVE